MGRKRKSKYWKGIPEELRLMCLAEVRGDGHYCTGPILEYLTDRMGECDSFVYGTMPYDIIRWIDTAVELCLFPLEQHEEGWNAHKNDIWRVLKRSEELIQRVAPADYRDGHRTMYDNRHSSNIIEYAQKLEVYFCVLYMFTEEWDRLEERLKQLRSFTESNVKHMLLCDATEEFASRDAWAKYHYSGTDVWEPINWLCKEFIPGGCARKLFAQTYEKYVLFLNGLEEGERSSRVCRQLCCNAEKRLEKICQLILDEIDDQLELSEGDEKELVADKAGYEGMLRRSSERCSKAAEDSEPCSKARGQSKDEAASSYYHKKWDAFTKKLRKLMLSSQ